MCGNRELFKEIMLALIVINLFDLYATQYLLSTGLFYEANYWLGGAENERFTNVITMKFICLMAFATFGMRCTEPSLPLMLVVTAALSVYVWLMLYHLYLISFTMVIV
jgi:hypothetical protein